MKLKIRFVLFVFVVLITLGFKTAEACSCARSETCQNFSRAEVVFVGKVVDSTDIVRKITRRERPIGGDWEENEYAEKRQISRILIEESFAGTGDRKEILIETEISSSCGLSLPKGVGLIVYANRVEGEENLMTHFCSGTGPVSDAQEELDYLRANKTAKANVSGKVGFGDWMKLDSSPLLKYGVTTVRLYNQENQFQTTIAADGSYKFADVPAGKYTVNVVLPDFLTLDDPNDVDETDETKGSELEISGHGCLKQDFLVRENGRISGKITDAEGKPVAEVTVYLIPVTKSGQKIKQEEPCYDKGLCVDSDEAGNFIFNGLKPGYYLVGVRLGDYVGSDTPDAAFLKTYYPGAALEKSAVPVNVKFGKQTAGIDFKLARTYPKREIKGRVFFKDGRPAANVRVRYVARTPDSMDSWLVFIKTDADGYFSFTGYENHAYLIGAFTDERDGNEFLSALAVVINVLPKKPVKEIKLVLDQDGTKDCPKCGDYQEFPKTKPAKNEP